MTPARRPRLWTGLVAGLLGMLWAAAVLAAPAATDPAPDDRRVLVLIRLAPEHYRADNGYAGAYGDGASQAARRRTAQALARAHGLRLAESWPMPRLGLDCYVMDVPGGRTPQQAADELSKDRAVEWSEPMHLYRAEAAPAPNDPLFRVQPAATAWRLADLHAVATGRGVRVAVIDSGVDVTHPDLASQVAGRQNFVGDRPYAAEIHGTSVAGVIAARENNRLGIAGVAPQARLLALRACWENAAHGTVCDTLSLAKALHYAVDDDVQVINLSLAGPPDRLLGRLIDTALADGATVVAAADPQLPRGGFPASHPGVISVGADGDGAAVSAPGRDVPTTLPGGRWSLVNGSSYAAAHVSGLMALIRQRAPRARGAAVLVTSHATGAIDACATLLRDAACGPPVGRAALNR